MNPVLLLSDEQLHQMQQLELEMLLEFDRICRMYSIKYVIYGGTLLGAVRHKGFIPWDDDADIVMLRSDYECFKQHLSELDSEICFFQDHDTDPEYRWGYGKLRRTGTKYVRVGQEHLKSKTGIFIDIFPTDTIPKSLFLQVLQSMHCFLLRKILWSEVAKMNSTGFLRIWYTLLSKIPVSFVYKQINWYVLNNKTGDDYKVRTLLFPAPGSLYIKKPLKERFGLPQEWITDRAEYDFEGHKLFGTRDYDTILTWIYGDYMTPPSPENRGQHSPVSEIVFPE